MTSVEMNVMTAIAIIVTVAIQVLGSITVLFFKNRCG
jgi:hypothetical protein